ncbi:MAG: hypothetical protein J3K34DRAFT_398491, partial [Monoraphidium minutum]
MPLSSLSLPSPPPPSPADGCCCAVVGVGGASTAASASDEPLVAAVAPYAPSLVASQKPRGCRCGAARLRRAGRACASASSARGAAVWRTAMRGAAAPASSEAGMVSVALPPRRPALPGGAPAPPGGGPSTPAAGTQRVEQRCEACVYRMF